jgi:hypothetical protein
MMAGDAAMVVALADSFFFSVEPTAARSRVLLFLVISFAPFLVVAPLIGPVIDRIRGGRRFVVQVTALGRVVLQLVMIRFVDDLALFPAVFAALVLQKTYAVSKSALVPSVVRSERELVEANSKLGLIAALTGAVAVVPAGILQLTLGSGATLWYGALVFAVAFVAATRLSPEQGPLHAAPGEAGEPGESPATVVQAARIMVVLRSCVGFLLFHLAFWFRDQEAGTLWFGLAVGLSSVGTAVGNLVAPRLRGTITEERMLSLALLLPAVAGLIAGVFGGRTGAVVLAVALNLGASIGRLAFESIVQRDAPGSDRGRTFARYEVRFQFGWVLAGTIAVALTLPGALGFLLVGVVSAAAVVLGRAGPPPGVRRRSGRPAVSSR